MRILIVLLITFLSLSACVKSPRWANISYAADTLTGHKLDIYLPESGEGPFPVIVVVAGSAWFSNNSKQRAFEVIGQPLLAEGFAVVAVNHRSSREAVWPAQINDMKAVVRFIRANAEKYNLNTQFIGMTGDSSGGHLSAMMGLTGGVNEYSVGSKTLSIEGNVGGNLTQDSRVDAVVDWYGPSVFQKMDSCGSSFSHDAPESPESILTGGPIQSNGDMCALANPITYIDANDPPFLVLHGDADMTVPHCQGIFLNEALENAGVSTRLIIVPGAGHGEGMWEEPYIGEMIGFFKQEMAEKGV